MILGVIPARYKSSRFPGKVLAGILGKTLVQRTYEQAASAQELTEVVVATDDKKVFDHVLGFGGKAVMTSLDCESGSDRAAEAVKRYFPHAKLVVNIQVDEPLVNPEVIDQLVKDHLNHPERPLMTPVAETEDRSAIMSTSTVKCVFDSKGRALYFSRSPIPFSQKKKAQYFRHMGIYSFQRSFLLEYANLSSTHLRETEDLEQLKAMEHGFPIYVTLVKDTGTIEVNYPEDIVKVEEILTRITCRENISL